MGEVTIKDIARICGVGVSTVSRAMNNHPDINVETKLKVQKAIEKYHYIPNNSARNLKRQESNTIAVLVQGMHNAFIRDMLTKGEIYVKKFGYSLYLQQVEEDENVMSLAAELVKEKRLKGLVFLGGRFSNMKENRKLLGVPFVILTSQTEETCSCVYVDDVEESSKIVNYLIQKGHTNIALITTPESMGGIGALRKEGYLKALRENGIELKENWIRHMNEDTKEFSIASGYQVTSKLLEEGVKFTAIYACSDYAAIGACKAIFDAGKSVPEDYSVAGYDGLEIGKYYHPEIATIYQPIQQMIEKALDILIQEIQGERQYQKVVFEGELLEGESVKKLSV